MNPARQLRALATCIALLFAHSASGAAFDAFLEIDGIAGETESGAIPANSWSFGASNPNSPCAARGGKGAAREASAPAVSEIVITKFADSSSPPLALACATGKHFDKVVLRVVANDATGQAVPYLEITLEDTLISGYSVGGSGGDRPTESLSLNFTKITFEYSAQRSGEGKPPAASWDLCTNKK